MKGERASKLSFGAHQENATASAVANARGIALGLLIFLKGRTEWNRGLRLLHCQYTLITVTLKKDGWTQRCLPNVLKTFAMMLRNDRCY